MLVALALPLSQMQHLHESTAFESDVFHNLSCTLKLCQTTGGVQMYEAIFMISLIYSLLWRVSCVALLGLKTFCFHLLGLLGLTDCEYD